MFGLFWSSCDSYLMKTIHAGRLGMTNCGPNTNSSQFFITTVPTPHLDGKHMLVGKVEDGFEILQLVASNPTNIQEEPILPVSITACGQL